MRYYKYVGSQKDADAFGGPKPIVGKIYKDYEKISGADVNFFAFESFTASLRNEWKEVSEEEYNQQQSSNIKYYKYVGSVSLAKEYFDPQPVVGTIYKGTDQAGSDTVEYWADKVVDEWKEVSEEEYGQQQACKKISELTGRSEESIMEDVQRMCSEAFKPELEKELENKIVEAYRKVDITKDVNTVWGDNNTRRYVSLEELVNKRDKPDKVSSPPHYNQGKIECIDAIESATINKSGFEGALVGNVIKYLWRYEEKGDKLTDIKKALWYLTKLKDHVESND